MSNVKRVRIEGDLNTLGVIGLAGAEEVTPYVEEDAVKGNNIAVDDIPEACKAAKRIAMFLAQSTFPHFGLDVRWTHRTRNEKNGYSGIIMHEGYVIEGEEAVPFAYMEELVKALGLFGRVDRKEVRDIEA